ncbi:MAG: ATP/GTP-binding protein [Gemmataceae bacterium]
MSPEWLRAWVPRVVLTGGPCAGKTTCLRALRARFGEQIVTVPEAATLLLDSGLPPPGHERVRHAEEEWSHAFQGAILSLQQTLEETWERLARRCRARLLVCDRGLLDGAAYWPGGRESFLRHFGLTVEECFARYQRVLHLQSLAEAHPHLYGPENNAIRYEDVTDALRVEQSARAAWEGHPGLIVVAAEDEPQVKIARVLEYVRLLLAMS